MTSECNAIICSRPCFPLVFHGSKEKGSSNTRRNKDRRRSDAIHSDINMYAVYAQKSPNVISFRPCIVSSNKMTSSALVQPTWPQLLSE